MSVKPKDLNVPAKGQETFQKNFGITWTAAVKDGKVYNAADACKKLGINGEQLDAKWGKIDRKTALIKVRTLGCVGTSMAFLGGMHMHGLLMPNGGALQFVYALAHAAVGS